MAVPRICVLRAPGTNCDVETAFAFEICGGRPERVHIFRLLEEPSLLRQFQVLCIPGGFSYGDDIGAGVIFSRELRGRLAAAIGEFLRADTLTLGICNGFQVLLKAGILPGGAETWPPSPGSQPEATLTWNDNGRYTAVWIRVGVESPQNVFLRGIESFDVPVAHAEGRIVVRDPQTITAWRQRGQIALCYRARQNGKPQEAADPFAPLPYPDNPNGSASNIAALGDSTGRVLGLMPHPERFLNATQHPQWTRRQLTGEGDGRKLFRNAVEYFK